MILANIIICRVSMEDTKKKFKIRRAQGMEQLDYVKVQEVPMYYERERVDTSIQSDNHKYKMANI